jgi:ubiquinone/menaquinone biosynthesis C-methylase UbiE
MVESVDYEVAASRYNRGRSLSEATITAWRAAVSPHVSTRSVVVDLGAGTGLWAQGVGALGGKDGDRRGTSPAMRRDASAGRPPAEVHIVAGRGEHLPLRDGCAGVVWMSTVLHHLTDRAMAAAEVRRVLDTRGVCLIRGFFADRSDNGWLSYFPGQERARATFPTVTEAAALFAQHGLALRHALAVTSDRNATLGEAAEWIRLMRSADSLLAAFTDEEIGLGSARWTVTRPGPVSRTRWNCLCWSQRQRDLVPHQNGRSR